MPQCLQVMRYIKLLLWQLTLDSWLYSLLLTEEVIFKCSFKSLQYRQLSGRLQGFLVVYFVRVLLLELACVLLCTSLNIHILLIVTGRSGRPKEVTK